MGVGMLVAGGGCGGASGAAHGVGVGEGVGFEVAVGAVSGGVAVRECAGDGTAGASVEGGRSQPEKTNRKQVSSMVGINSLFIYKAMVVLREAIVNIWGDP